MLKAFLFTLAFIGVGSQVIVYQLDKATAEQCRTHAWPVDKHQVHLAWCAANNYSVN